MSLSRTTPYEARFVAARFSWLNHVEHPSLIRLYPHKPKNMYWGAGGLTHCGYDEEKTTILKDYGVHSDHDDDAIDALEFQYYKDFPPQPSKTLELSEGWLSPEGVFYDCSYGEHSSLAHHLSMAFYDSHRGERLIEETHIRIYDRMAMMVLDAVPTEAQIETLRKMAVVNSDKPHFVKAFHNFCELHDMTAEPDRVTWWAD